MNWKTAKQLAWIGAAGATAAGVAAGVGLGLAGWYGWQRFHGMDLADKIVLITGGSRGLGLVMAQEFAARGAHLAICARDQQELDWAREELSRISAGVLAVRCDVTDREDVNAMVRQVTERFGRIDVLVNNAGIISVGPMESQNLPDYQEAMDVMFWGMVYPTLAVLPQMVRRRNGRIANITSIGGKISVPHLLPYNCAKFAAVGFSEGLRAELAKDGIKVSTVVPGLMRTGSHVNAYFKGNHGAEYTWFSLSATLPGISMPARRAARRVVEAVRHGDAEIILTPQAKLAVMFHGLFPGLTADVLGVANRLMPRYRRVEGEDGLIRRRGKESETVISQSPLTSLGKKAAEEFHQDTGEKFA